MKKITLAFVWIAIVCFSTASEISAVPSFVCCPDGCPADSSDARLMVDLLLEDPDLAAETGTSAFTIDSVSVVQDSSLCAQLSGVAPSHPDPDYYRTYFVAGTGETTRYFVVYTIPGVEDPDPADDEVPVRYAMAYIGVLDSNFAVVESYRW